MRYLLIIAGMLVLLLGIGQACKGDGNARPSGETLMLPAQSFLAVGLAVVDIVEQIKRSQK
jgi:hypothetical protein